MTERLRLIAVDTCKAAGISIVINFLLFVIEDLVTDPHSALLQLAEGLLTPAGWISNRFLNGHSGSGIFAAYLISVAFYTALIALLLSAARERKS